MLFLSLMLQCLFFSFPNSQGSSYDIHHVCESGDISDGYGSMTMDQPNKAFRLSRPFRAQLCACLDPPRSLGNDWRMLAAKLGVDG